VALLTFGAGLPVLHPPRASKPGVVAVRRALSEGVARDGHSNPRALADALRRVGRVASAQAGLVVVISDFRDQHDWTRTLGALRARHSVLAVEVRDPREGALPAVGRLALIDPETGERIEIDSNNRRLRERFAAAERRDRDHIAGELRRLRVDHVVLSTDRDWLFDLGRTMR